MKLFTTLQKTLLCSVFLVISGFSDKITIGRQVYTLQGHEEKSHNMITGNWWRKSLYYSDVNDDVAYVRTSRLSRTEAAEAGDWNWKVDNARVYRRESIRCSNEIRSVQTFQFGACSKTINPECQSVTQSATAYICAECGSRWIPKRLGIKNKGTKITKVQGGSQAEGLGVKVNWIMTEIYIDNTRVEINDGNVTQTLAAAKCNGAPFVVAFNAKCSDFALGSQRIERTYKLIHVCGKCKKINFWRRQPEGKLLTETVTELLIKKLISSNNGELVKLKTLSYVTEE